MGQRTSLEAGVPAAVPRQQTPVPLSYLFELTDDLICAANPEGYFTRCNPAFQRVLGWPPEVLLTTPFVELVHPEDRRPTLAQLSRLRQGDKVIDFNNRYRTKEGEYVWIRWKAYVEPGGETIFATGQVLPSPSEAPDSAPNLETTFTRVLRHHEHSREQSRAEEMKQIRETSELGRAEEGRRADLAEKKAKTFSIWIGAFVAAASIAGSAIGWAVSEIKESRQQAVEQAVEAEKRRIAAEAAKAASDNRFTNLERSDTEHGDQIDRLGELYLGQQVQMSDGFEYTIKALQVIDPKVKRKVGDVPDSISEGGKAAKNIKGKRALEELFADDPATPLAKPAKPQPAPDGR